MIALDGTTADATLIGKICRGYSITPLGSVVGLARGLIDGLIGGAIIAWLYSYRRLSDD